MQACLGGWHLSRHAVVKSEDCLLALASILKSPQLTPPPFSPSITLEMSKRNCLKTTDIWGKMFIGFWDLDQTLSWCLRSGFNQCCNLLAPVAVFFGSGIGLLWLHYDRSSEHMSDAHPRKSNLVPLMPFPLFFFYFLLFVKLLLVIIVTCRQASISISKANE